MITFVSSKIPQIEIDLNAPEGSATMLIAYARHLAYLLGLSEQEAEEIVAEMRAGDYEHLLQVFEANFGEYVIMYR